jgi:hypothetical protein
LVDTPLPAQRSAPALVDTPLAGAAKRAGVGRSALLRG